MATNAGNHKTVDKIISYGTSQRLVSADPLIKTGMNEFLISINIVDCILDGSNFFRVFIGYVHIKFFFHGHN